MRAAWQKQPLDLPSAGSIFKRRKAILPRKLVQDCGLRGYRIGGAEVSGCTVVFIVNTGNAAARDVISLIEYIKDAVYNKFGVILQTEVKIIGED